MLWRCSTVGVEHLCFEEHFWWLIGEVIWKFECGLVESSFEGGVFGSLEADSPVEEVIIDESDGDGEVGLAFLCDCVVVGLRSNCFLMCSMASFLFPAPYICDLMWWGYDIYYDDLNVV